MAKLIILFIAFGFASYAEAHQSRQTNPQYWKMLCLSYGGHYCDHVQEPAGQTLSIERRGENCDYFAAYLQAKNAIDHVCMNILGGDIVGDPAYDMFDYDKITTGSCSGNNGLGTYHIVKLRAVCEY